MVILWCIVALLKQKELEMKAEFKTITPIYAAKLLEANKSNRSMRQKKVEQYCRDMRAGKFVTTHQGIAVYENGILADGQHRLMAICKTGIPCKILVVSGIPFEQDHILAIDNGTVRSVTDSSSISGMKISTSEKSLIRWLKGSRMGEVSAFKISMTHAEVMEAAKDLSEYIEMINGVMKSNRKGVTVAPVKAAMCVAWDKGVDLSIINGFASFLYTGQSNGMFGKDYIRLRDRLLSTTLSASDSGEVFTRVIKMLKKTHSSIFGKI